MSESEAFKTKLEDGVQRMAEEVHEILRSLPPDTVQNLKDHPELLDASVMEATDGILSKKFPEMSDSSRETFEGFMVVVFRAILDDHQ